MNDDPIHNHPDMQWDMAWQSIESAPKDGTSVLLWGIWAGEINGPAEHPSIDIGYWGSGESDYDGNDWWALSTGDAYACWMRPTHWMPLPTPPQQYSKE